VRKLQKFILQILSSVVSVRMARDQGEGHVLSKYSTYIIMSSQAQLVNSTLFPFVLGTFNRPSTVGHTAKYETERTEESNVKYIYMQQNEQRKGLSG